VAFNQNRPADRFDGIHLDIEPQQRPDNKGAGNLRFLLGLAGAHRAARAIAAPAAMTESADIQNELLKGSLGEHKRLLSAVPRDRLMTYELSEPGDGESVQQKTERVHSASKKFQDIAYDGSDDRDLAKMAIALRTLDCGEILPQMLQKFDEATRANPQYPGWPRHSYNNYLLAH